MPRAATAIARTEQLYVTRSPIHGTGVFAAQPFAAGDEIERCPVVVCRSGQEHHLEQTELRGLYFTWRKASVALALGFGSLYNHSWHPNARYEMDYRARIVRYVAVADIAAGDEVTINYTGEPDGRGELWFDTDPPED